MCGRTRKLWVWKNLAVCIMLTGIVTLSFYITQPEKWGSQNLPFQSLVNDSKLRSDSAHVPLPANDNLLSAKVIMHKNPYLTDPDCQNYSLRLYDDDTFEISGLVSYPGSGNTWTRHLIQLASGVYTGSFYFDMELFGRGFYGEKEAWFTGRTIVQKFHEKYNKEFGVKRAVLVIREPFPAILAFANYLEAGHTGNSYLLPYHHRNWPNFLLQSAYNWLSLAKSWIESSATILVVHYEHLKLHPVENVEKMCRFLNHSCPHLFTPCFRKHLEGSFHRSKPSWMRGSGKNVARMAKYPEKIKYVVSRGIDHLNQLLVSRGQEPAPFNLYQHYAPVNISATESPLLQQTNF